LFERYPGQVSKFASGEAHKKRTHSHAKGKRQKHTTVLVSFVCCIKQPVNEKSERVKEMNPQESVPQGGGDPPPVHAAARGADVGRQLEQHQHFPTSASEQPICIDNDLVPSVPNQKKRAMPRAAQLVDPKGPFLNVSDNQY